MQYPQIQFYRGSLVRLASGELKQVEDLSSDDFLESARLIHRSNHQLHISNTIKRQLRPASNLSNATSLSFNDDNNNSVFNSPEPTPSFNSSSPNADSMMEIEDHNNNNTNNRNQARHSEEEEEEIDDDDEELDVVSGGDEQQQQQPFNLSTNAMANQQNNQKHISSHDQRLAPSQAFLDEHDPSLPYIDSSVVKDFLEVGPTTGSSANSPNSAASSPVALTAPNNIDLYASSSSSSGQSGINQPNSPPATGNQTVLIKFFLESSRRIVFIEVPIERPFFVFHRGWSSWNPQRTYDKFGLKCRKLKIGDTCISLIRRQHKQPNPHHQSQQQQLQDSDNCNILFSSIKLNE